jgi:hypothetical protein
MRQQFKVLSGKLKRPGQRLQEVALFDEAGDPMIFGVNDPFTIGFSMTPDAIYNIPSSGFVVGDGFTPVASPKIHRWGHLINFTSGGFNFYQEDLNDYGFYNEIVSLPLGWLPVGIDDANYPFRGIPVELQHYAEDQVTLRQVDSEILVPSATGLILDNDRLDASLFQPEDYIAFVLGRRVPSMTVLPTEATFE